MTKLQRRILIAPVVLTAAAFFGLGLLVAGRLAERSQASSSADATFDAAAIPDGSPLSPDAVAGDAGPRILFDPSSISLLPDASLHLDLPGGFDAGPPP